MVLFPSPVGRGARGEGAKREAKLKQDGIVWRLQAFSEET